MEKKCLQSELESQFLLNANENEDDKTDSIGISYSTIGDLLTNHKKEINFGNTRKKITAKIYFKYDLNGQFQQTNKNKIMEAYTVDNGSRVVLNGLSYLRINNNISANKMIKNLKNVHSIKIVFCTKTKDTGMLDSINNVSDNERAVPVGNSDNESNFNLFCNENNISVIKADSNEGHEFLNDDEKSIFEVVVRRDKDGFIIMEEYDPLCEKYKLVSSLTKHGKVEHTVLSVTKNDKNQTLYNREMITEVGEDNFSELKNEGVIYSDDNCEIDISEDNNPNDNGNLLIRKDQKDRDNIHSDDSGKSILDLILNHNDIVTQNSDIDPISKDRYNRADRSRYNLSRISAMNSVATRDSADIRKKESSGEILDLILNHIGKTILFLLSLVILVIAWYLNLVSSLVCLILLAACFVLFIAITIWDQKKKILPNPEKIWTGFCSYLGFTCCKQKEEGRVPSSEMGRNRNQI